MIKANEIRIGNVFIRELHTSRGLEYDHDFTITEEGMGKLFGETTALALQDLFPIPITPEILEAFGFVKDYTGFALEDKMSLSFSITKDGKYFPCWLDRALFPISNEKSARTIEHLHQLQNLYFSLTGQELTFKQPATKY